MATSAQRTEPQFDVDRNVADVVRTLLGMHGMNQQDLRRKLGHSPSAMSTRMTGKARWTVAEIYQMSRIFGVPVEVFYRPPALVGAGAPTAPKVRETLSTAA